MATHGGSRPPDLTLVPDAPLPTDPDQLVDHLAECERDVVVQQAVVRLLDRLAHEARDELACRRRRVEAARAAVSWRAVRRPG